MSKKRITKTERKKGHQKLMEYISNYSLDTMLSDRSLKILSHNELTLDEFFAFSYSDFMELKFAGKISASEMYSVAEKYRYILDLSKEGNNTQIIRTVTSLNEDIECAHDKYLSDIFCSISDEHYIKTFSIIFDTLKSIFRMIETESGYAPFGPLSMSHSVYSYLYSIRHGNYFIISSDAIAYIPDMSKPLNRFTLFKRERQFLECFDEAFLRVCISYIGHIPNDTSHINIVIGDVLYELLKEHDDIRSLLPLEALMEIYKLKYGRYSVFSILNKRFFDESMPSYRRNRILYKRLFCGMSFEDICDQEGCTSSTIGNIYNRSIKYIKDWAQNSGILDDLRKYDFYDLAYLTPENTKYNEIKEKEFLWWDFNYFCAIVAILLDDKYCMYSRIKITSTSQENKIYVYKKYIAENFDLTKIFNHIQKYYSDPLTSEIELNPILSRKEFRITENVSDEIINDIKGLLVYVCHESFDLNVTDADEPFEDISVFLTPEKIKAIIVDILMQNKSPMSSDLILNALVTINPKAYKNLSIDKVKSFLSDKKTFKQVGLKSLYTLASSSNYVGSVTKSIGKTLCESKEPIKMQELIQKVLLLRPDSNERSVRSFITSMIKRNECTLYKDTYVGLTSRIDEYPSKYEPDESVSKQSFGERIQTLFDFVEKYQRMPNMQGDAREKSLAAWYRRINADPDLSVDKLVLIDRVEQICRENHYPKDANECDFRDNSEQVKAIIMRTGKLPQMQEDKALYEWLFRTSKREQNLSGFYKEEYAALKQFMSDFNLG